MTAREIMIQLLFKIATLTGDVEPVDVNALVDDPEYQEIMWYMSLNSYFEAGGFSFEDKIAVSQSVIHRRDDTENEFRNYDDVISIITKASRDSSGNVKRYQCWYSWYCDGKPDNPRIYFGNGKKNVLEYEAWEESVIAAFMAYHDLYPDIVGGSTHYYNPKIADAYWRDHYELYGMVGSHRFYTQR